MAVNFPSNPTNGQTVTVSGITYAYDSTQGVWSDSPQGLTQAIDALTDVDTSTSAPSNGQVLQWNSTDSEWQPADADAGVTVYATIDDLPLTGVTEGSMALVDSTDKLYIYSDTGWYSISIVNQTPTISGVSATYALATDGTATTVTVTATDPEGIPLTYSIVSDTSGSVATVVQGTGSNTNQWTITPSTNTADAGNFTLVFRASDGTNIASASSTFTLVFGPAKVNNSKYTTALITSVGANNAANDTFSWHTGGSTFTNNGSVTQSTYSPLRSGGFSHYYYDTLQSYYSATLSSSLGTGSWTLEGWFYKVEDDGRDFCTVCHVGTVNGSNSFSVAINDTQIRFRANGTTTSDFSITNTRHRWIYLAIVYDGTDVEVFENGSSLGSAARSLDITETALSVGYYNTSFSFEGYISDFRLSTVARSISSSPTERLTSDSNTLFLMQDGPYVADISSNGVALTKNGTVDQVTFAPYDREEYDAADHGGSMYFDQSSYLAFPSNTTITMFGTDQTVEFWAWHEGSDGDGVIGSINDTSFLIGLDNRRPYIWVNSQTLTNISGYSISNGHTASGNTAVSDGWHHYAFDIDRGASTTVLTVYVDGAVYGSLSWANTSLTARGVGRGLSSQFTRYFVGYISGLRVVNSRVYTSAFDLPTAPPTAITGTQLLLNGTDAAIIDKSQSVKTITLNGSAKSSTAQTKYLTSSMSFAAQTDSLKVELPGTLGTGDFTIEWWVYFTNINPGGSNFRRIIDMRHAGDSSNLWLQQSGDGSWSYYPNYPTTGFTSSTFSNNTWYHIAIARENGTIRFYVDGSLTGSGSDSFDYDSVFLHLNDYSSTNRRWTGYASDLRVTKGLARYTASDETANIPSAALEG